MLAKAMRANIDGISEGENLTENGNVSLSNPTSNSATTARITMTNDDVDS